MKKYKNNLEKSAKAALLSSLPKIPLLKVIDIQKEKYEKDVIADRAVKIELPIGIIQLIAEVENSGQPRFARETVNQMLSYKNKVADAYFVFIAPYIY